MWDWVRPIEAGILVSELIARGRGQRILVVAVKSMLTQFQKEFWNRFTIPLTRLDSVGIQRVRRRIPSNHNPFHYHDRSIISIDTLKQDREYRTYRGERKVGHHCDRRSPQRGGTRKARRSAVKLAKRLAKRSDTLIMLSATPHDGKARSFASLMNMLDPTAIGDPDDFTQEDFQHKALVIRRFKKDVRERGEEVVSGAHGPPHGDSRSPPWRKQANEALLAVRGREAALRRR